ASSASPRCPSSKSRSHRTAVRTPSTTFARSVTTRTTRCGASSTRPSKTYLVPGRNGRNRLSIRSEWWNPEPATAAAVAGSGFHHSLRIDNRFLPFRPGTRYVFDGRVDDAPHRVVLVVTDLAKVVDGV